MFCGYVALLLTRLPWWQAAGFTQLATGRKLLVCLPLLYLPLLVVAANGFKAGDTLQMLGATLLIVLVALAEEGLVRGVVLQALLPGGMTRAVWLSAAIFGLAHLLNIAQGASVAATVVQVVYAMLLGIGLAATRLTTGSLWPAIVLHFLIDFVDIASRGFVLTTPVSVTLGGAIVTIVLTSGYALYGGWLLRRAGKSNPSV